MRKLVSGIAASSGIVIAKAYKLSELNLDFSPKSEINITEEIEIFESAIDNSIAQLNVIKNDAIKKLGEEEAQVFEAHKTILMDPELLEQVKNLISSNNDAPTSVKNVTDQFISIFENMDDEYFKARAADIKDVTKRLIANVLGISIPDLALIDEEVIIVANDLTPSETSQLDKKFTKGFVTNIGGRTSHAAIMARSLEIPAVVGTNSILSEVNNGDTLILNAVEGFVIINPTEQEIEDAKLGADKLEKQKQRRMVFKDKKTISSDGSHVELCANIGTPDDVEGVLNNGAEGVGLYRTEFLYMDAKALPTEEEQFIAYKKVLVGMNNKPVVVRTLDIGGDKELPYLQFPEEMNPFLGYRAIRLTLDRTDIFITQLRALLRASEFGKLRIMFPMVATLNEFRDAKALLLEQKKILISEGVKVSDDIEVGIMVEIPSTAVMADTFAKEVDFFSIGTNDLIQYTMAADRMSEKVSYLYQPYNPAILRLVKNVVDAAKKHNKWAGMCGEMASDPVAITILLGIGLFEFSMSPSAILAAREQISKLDKSEIEKHVDLILDLSTSDEVENYIKNNLMKKDDE